jgi:GT2 family glycosyltransferase
MKSGTSSGRLENPSLMRPLVSIIIPTYQREELLCETITYLLGQDYLNHELLIVDQSDSHTPETSRFLESVASRVRYFRLKQPNLPAARNFGIRESRGEIIVFVDDDMVIGPNVISRLVETYSASEVWGASGFVLSPDESDEGKYLPYAKFVNDLAEFRHKERVKINEYIGCFMSFRRQLFDKVGYFDEWIGTQLMAAGEDFEFCRRATLRGYGLFLNPAITTLHLNAREGGCNRRSTIIAEVERTQLRLGFYAVLKNRQYRGWLGWAHALARCYRIAMLNRGSGNSRVSLARRHARFWKALRDAAAALRAASRPEGTLFVGPRQKG